MRAIHCVHVPILRIKKTSADFGYNEGLTATETMNEAIARHSQVTGVIDASQNVTNNAAGTYTWTYTWHQF